MQLFSTLVVWEEVRAWYQTLFQINVWNVVQLCAVCHGLAVTVEELIGFGEPLYTLK